MAAEITSVDPKSPASRAGIRAGESLLAINGKEVIDVLDYKFYAYDTRLALSIQGADGLTRQILVKKQEGEELGFNFETYLMDQPRPCKNKCVFCFVDQLPRGMRKSLYFKDDDARLSFLLGNYITLTNLSDRELQRIIDLRISPINVSVHATEPELRAVLLGSPLGAKGYAMMQRLADGGITMNCQIVACPGLNDGDALKQSMTDLSALYPNVSSVSIVPVGLTKHRQKCYPLESYTQSRAYETVKQIEAFAAQCLEKYGSRMFFASDEFYLRAQLPLPTDEEYEDYPQLENGVGMLRLFETEFMSALEAEEAPLSPPPCSIATGVSAAPFLRKLIDTAAGNCHTISCEVYAIINDFLGHTIDVAGLLTGQDILAQLKNKPLGERLFLPQNCIRHGETVFLDDMTVAELSKALNVPITLVPQDGGAFFDCVIGGQYE